MKIRPIRTLIRLFALSSLFTAFAFAEERPQEEVEANAVSNAETIVKASAPHSLAITVRNTHGATSPLTIEIREGGCEGRMIARFPLRSNDSVIYNCAADFVRIVADDPATSKYSYDISFQKSERKPLSHSFEATGKNSLYADVSNTNASMTVPVVVNSSTNDGTANREITIEPKVRGYWSEPADRAKVSVGEGANAFFTYTVRFISQ